jgi:hypothetical protein
MLKVIGQNLGALISRVSGALLDLLRELAGLAAIALIAYGAWLIYEPAGFITAGVLLLIGTILLGMKR